MDRETWSIEFANVMLAHYLEKSNVTDNHALKVYEAMYNLANEYLGKTDELKD